jgi:hypothetical protein
MEIRLKALIATKNAITPSFCAGQKDCSKACPLFNNGVESCYWMKAVTAIDDLEMIFCGYGYDINNDTKPERSTKEQSRFDDIM